MTPVAAAEELTVSSQVDKTELSEGEVLTYSITIAGPIQENPQVNLGEVKGFAIVSTGQSHQLEVRRGTIQRAVVLTYLLTPTEPGTHTLGPVKVTTQGQVYETQPIPVKVTARTEGPRPKLRGGIVL